MQNFFETNLSEATSYLNLRVILHFTITALIPVILLTKANITYKNFWGELLSKLKIISICLLIIASIGGLFYKDYASIARNNQKIGKDIIPVYSISKFFKYIKKEYLTSKLPYTKLAEDAKLEEDDKYLVIFLVGETARAQNYQLNGYERETNKYTKNIENLFYFSKVSSCGTATAISLPCMFSMLNKNDYSREKFEAQDNVLDILKRAGIEMLWIDNNTGCKEVCKDIRSLSTLDVKNMNCKDENCDDGVFLNILDEEISNFDDKNAVIYMHLIGSHGPTYYKRYPREKAEFLPDCQTSDIQNCSDEEIINSYDNTILYTDYVMSKIISYLKDNQKGRKVAVFYVSDHGESLGEKGLYLHGMPYVVAPDYQTKVPLIFWFSDELIKHENYDLDCIRNTAKNSEFSHDNITHTLLDLMDVETEAYIKDKDILEKCERE
jgi:lipid A ethanolaminephosphotransferase